MKVRSAIARAGLSTRLAIAGWGTMALLVAVGVTACTGSGHPGAQSSFSPARSTSPTPTARRTATGSASASASASASVPASPTARPSATPSPASSPTATPPASATPRATHTSQPPTAAPATGGGGTAGPEDPLLFAIGGMAVLAGAASLAYRRRLIRRQ